MNEPNTAPDPGRLDVFDAVEAILIPEDSKAAPSEDEVTPPEEAAITAGNEQGKDQPAEQEQPKEEPQAEQAEEAEEEPEETEEESEETEEETEPVAEAEEPEEEEEQPVLFTTPEGEQVTLDELKKGYLRQSDYTKKTQSVAEERKQVEQAAQMVGGYRQTLAENLNMALNIIEPQLAELSQTNWDQLAADDAYEYAEKRAKYDQAVARYNQIVNASQQVIQQQEAQTQANFQAKKMEEQKALAMAIPDMADPKIGPKLAQSIREYATERVGLSEEEAGNIIDHRIIVILNKARQFDDLSESSVSVAKKKVAKTPKRVVRSGQPVSKAEQTKSAGEAKRSRLKRSGSVEDAVDLILTGS